MSYSIIFETKIVALSDGRLLHLDLSGCNNDNAGRDRGDFTGKIYTREEFVKRANDFCKDSEPYHDSIPHDLKIGSRYCTWYDYGAHLLRMMDRAVTWQELDCPERHVRVERIDGADVYVDGVPITMSIREFDDYARERMYSGNGIRYCIRRTTLTTEEEVVKALDNNEKVSFYIGKMKRKK